MLRAFFEGLLHIPGDPAVKKGDASEKVVSFSCLSPLALRLYFGAFVSDCDTALNSLDRMWKIYRFRVQEFIDTLHHIVVVTPKEWILDALNQDCTTTLFSFQPHRAKEEWFGVR